MKISIFDEEGSTFTSVLNLDGSTAVEGVNFMTWKGQYHKNGKWSYHEGGIALKEGAYAKITRSSHSYANMLLSLHIIKDDVEISQCYIGKVSELDFYPDFEGENKELFISLFESHLSTRKPEFVEKMRERWQNASLFY